MTIENPNTTIQITKYTKQELAKIGRKENTYEEIIQELLSKWKFEK